jgi:hypothetical protein
MPIKHRKQFEKKFIKYYHQIKVPNVTKRDPLTKRDFTDMDQVVVSEDGKRVLALTTWKYYKGGKENEAGDYADLFPADLRASQFFSQRGDFKRFNWLWFGALGGGIAWAVLAIFKAVDLTWYQTFLSSWADREDEQISTAIFGDTLLGIAMGIGIITTLSWVEERGQSQKFSIGRVLLRVMLGVIGAYLVFLVQSFLLMKYIPIWEYSPLVRSCVGWLLFGAVLGLTLSFASSITPATGVKGGLLAAFIAFVVYSILDLPVFHSFFDSQIVAAIGYMTFGGVLGYTLHTVVAMYEDYELRCLSPRDFAMWQSPISKWLKSPSIEYIVIGKNPKSTVYVKWPDTHVADFHARMSLIKGLPHISPDQGEVLVNDMRISGPTPLENGDRIKLGSQSVSVLQFLAKESKLPPGSGRNLSASPAPAPSSGGGKGRSPQEAAQIRKQIQIKRK